MGHGYMKTFKIIVKGTVQRVGYRNSVYRIAKGLGIVGNIRNLDDPDESVEIFAQGVKIDDFLDAIKINNGVIDVKSIEKKETADEELFNKFEITRGTYEVENAERLDVAAYFLEQQVNETKTGFRESKERLTDGFGKVEGKLDTFHHDTSKRFDVMENKYGTVSENLEKIAKDLHELVDILRMFKPKEAG